MERIKHTQNHRNSDRAVTVSTDQAKDRTVDVLYQKLGNKWFAFSLIDDEVFFGSVDAEKISKKKDH